MLLGLLAISCFFAGCGAGGENSSSSAQQTETTELTQATTAESSETIITEKTESPYIQNVKEMENNGKLIAGVPHYSQKNSFLTACETLAAVSALQYYGIDIMPEEFIEKYLPIADYPRWDETDGELHGEDPHAYFLGDPMAIDAYGCYNGAIVEGVNQIHENLAYALDGETLESLCETYIDNGHPVILWATMNMDATYEGNSWILPDGSRFTFICPEHALVLIGYDKENYYFSDSLQDEDVYSYSKETVETAYRAMGGMAVVIDSAGLPE